MSSSPGLHPRSPLAIVTAIALVVAGMAVAGIDFGDGVPAAVAAAGAQRPAPIRAGASDGLTLPGHLGPVFEPVVPTGRRAVEIPVLEYHYIRVDSNARDRLGFNLSVTPHDFTAQMDWLGAHHYHAVDFDDLRLYFAGAAPLPARPVVLTFDDGYLDFFTTAEPILKAHRFKAVAYVVPGFWGRPRYMTPDELVRLDRSGLVEIGSHTMDHADLTIEAPGQRAYELEHSMAMLQALLGHQVVDFCYPTGRFDAAVVAAVVAAGYQTATTELPGTEIAWDSRYVFPRVRVAGGETLSLFVRSLGDPDRPVIEPVAPPDAPLRTRYL